MMLHPETVASLEDFHLIIFVDDLGADEHLLFEDVVVEELEELQSEGT